MSKFIIGSTLKRSVYSYIISKKIYSDNNNDLMKLFKEIDTNNDGKLDIDEIMSKYGQYFSDIPEEQYDNIRTFIEKVDINNSGFIEYSEFLTINNIVNGEINKKMLKEVFDFFDKTKNGTIDIEDLKILFRNSNLETEKIDEMLNEFDSDYDQSITFAEFYDKITSFIDGSNN
jgi:calcium-dependent protein kinase